jgi:hypothetical protein
MTEMVTALRRSRSAERNRQAWNEAVGSGFARIVIRESSAASTPSDHITLQRAERHVVLETQIESADIKTQRKLLAQLHRSSDFVIDTLPTIGTAPPPRSVEELIQLAYDAQFVEIATHLARIGLPSLENHKILPSIADRAVFEADRPTLESTTSPGVATLTIHWPRAKFCNVLELSLKTGSGIPTTEVVYRDQLSAPVERQVRLSSGGHLNVFIRTGISTPSGNTFFASRSLISGDIEINPTPKPLPRSFSQPFVSADQVVLIDPDEEERQRLAAVKKQRTRRRNRILLTVVFLLSCGSGYWAWQSFNSDTKPPLLEYRY